MELEKARGTAAEVPMRLETKVFDICNGKYTNLSEVALAMGISVSQIYRVRQGKRSTIKNFSSGQQRPFPNVGDLFHVVPDGSQND